MNFYGENSIWQHCENLDLILKFSEHLNCNLIFSVEEEVHFLIIQFSLKIPTFTLRNLKTFGSSSLLHGKQKKKQLMC